MERREAPRESRKQRRGETRGAEWSGMIDRRQRAEAAGVGDGERGSKGVEWRGTRYGGRRN